MANKDFKLILNDIKAKKYAPVYFLQGDESFFIDQIVEYIEKNVLDEAEKSFNQVVLYGKETDFKQVVDQAMQFPMMASHRVIIVKEAQSMSSIADLASYIAQPSTQSILVLAHKHKKLDKRKKKIWDALKKNAVILETTKLYDNQVPAYVMEFAQAEGLKLDNKSAFLLTEHLGSDLNKIYNEIKKLGLNLEKGSQVTAEDIQNFVGISKDFNVFELQKAIGTKNKLKAYSIVKYFSQNSKAHPIQMNVASLYNYFSSVYVAKKYIKSDDRTLASKLRVNPYFVKDYKMAANQYSLEKIRYAFKMLHRMDKHSKGVEVRKASDLGMYQEFLFGLFSDN